MSDQAKITETHLRRRAVVYVRQSTLTQVQVNTESSERQYALRERALKLGWPASSISVVNEDTACSGSSSEGRLGFKELVAEVGLGRVGLILALETSRLARSSADWHKLLDLCVLTETLIADADGIYSPGQFNDRLLLGLKGTMSEAELHLIRARLDGGLRNKAKRGELRLALPVGLDHEADDRIVLCPDEGRLRSGPGCKGRRALSRLEHCRALARIRPDGDGPSFGRDRCGGRSRRLSSRGFSVRESPRCPPV